MAVSFKRGDTFRINGNLVVPAGTIKREISVRKAAVDNLIIGKEDAVTSPVEKPYSEVLDSTIVTVSAPVNEAPIAVNTGSVPSFGQSIAEQDNATNLSKSGEEPVISVEAPKANSTTGDEFSAPIDPNELLNQTQEVVNNQTGLNQPAIVAEVSNTGKVLQFPVDDESQEESDVLKALKEAREASVLTTQIIEQKIAILENSDQHKMAA